MPPRGNKSAANSRQQQENGGQKSIRTCPFCQRTFNKNEHALRHIRSHTKERPFRCKHCGKAYPRSDTLRRHERNHEKSQNIESEISEDQSLHGNLADNEQDASIQAEVFFTTSVPANHLTPSQGDILVEQGQHEAVTGPNGLLSELQNPIVEERPSTTQNIQSNGATSEYPSNVSPSELGIHSCNTVLDSDVTSLDMTFSNLSGSNISHDGWLLSSDFDIDAVNSALNDTLFEWAQAPPLSTIIPWVSRPAVQQNQQEHLLIQQGGLHEPLHGGEGHATLTSRTSNPTIKFPSVDKWYARWQQEEAVAGSGNFISRAASEDPQDRLRADEQYGATLSRHLRLHQYEETRLSVSYLNECLRLYFARFHPIFPVIHFPSFRPNSRNALLFLSMCSIGSMFVGSPSAISQGFHIYSRLNKAILASWETHLSGTPQRSLSMVQAALIGQTFGLLSGKSNNLIMTDMFQGTMISWARKLGCFSRTNLELPPQHAEPAERARAWKEWIYAEQLRRLLLALYIHDAELSSLLHHEPLMRHMSCQYNPVLNDSLFEASSAEEWCSLLNNVRPRVVQANATKFGDWMANCSFTIENSNPVAAAIAATMENSHLASYTILENLNASIIESRRLGELDIKQQQKFAQALIRWSKSFQSTTVDSRQDRLALRLLWHSCFMNLSTDFDNLERVLGRDGQTTAIERSEEVANWAASTNALRCLLHATAMQALVEGMRMNWTPPIHVPRSLFSAGIAWICYRCWRKSKDNLTEQQWAHWDGAISQFSETQNDNWIENRHVIELMNLLGSKAGTHYEGAIYGIIGLLQRLDRWVISSSFARILLEASSEILHE